MVYIFKSKQDLHIWNNTINGTERIVKGTVEINRTVLPYSLLVSTTEILTFKNIKKYSLFADIAIANQIPFSCFCECPDWIVQKEAGGSKSNCMIAFIHALSSS